MTRWLLSTQCMSHIAKIDGHCLTESGDKAFSAYHVITSSMSHVTRWMRYPHPNSQRL